jgi:integrase/recombinase XerD
MATRKQAPKPALSVEGQAALESYAHYLHHAVDLRTATVRNYLSDVQQFMAWCEQSWAGGDEGEVSFSPQRVVTPTLTRYRDYLQTKLGRKPATVNRYLVSLKRYFAWAVDQALIMRDPARVVKPVGQTTSLPRHLDDKEEDTLVATLEAAKHLRDWTLVILMLHTGLRVSEVCNLKCADVVLGVRSGRVQVWGKRNKYREVPLNSTARLALTEYFREMPSDQEFLFISRRTKSKLTPRAIGFLLAKYARRAGIADLHPHDLRHRFGYRMAEQVPLHRLAQLMGHDSLDTTLIYTQGTLRDLQRAVESIAWK